MKHVVQSRLPRAWQCLTSVVLLGWLAFLSGAAAEKLAWKQEAGYRHAPATIAPNGKTGFTLLPASTTGIQFSNHLAIARAMANQNLMNGAGVALGDYDGDGLCDLYFCNLGGTNALYHNLGEWKFEEVAATAGLACTNRSSTGAVFADLNGDGRLDLVVVSCGGPNSCFFNEGNGHFREAVLPAGESTRTGSNSITLADVDSDGDLDLFVANYGEISILRSGGMPSVKVVNGKEEVVGRLRDRIKIRPDGTFVELGEPAVLYLNNGQGDFAPVPWTGGAFLDEDGKPVTAAFWDLGLSAAFHDLNGDGFPDLYICNDFQTPDRIWLNDGKGHFRALPRLAMRHSSSFSMSVDFADINRDGLVDFFVADMLSPTHYLKLTQIDGGEHPPRIPGSLDDRPQIRRNTLFLNRGDGTYGDIANFAGVAASDWTWCSVFLDVDMDGYEDLLIANGHAFDTQDSDAIENTRPTGKQSINESRRRLLQFPPLAIPNLIYRNRGDLTFEETGAKWGFDSKQVSHGIALADLDNDGDQDVVVSCLNAPPLIYRNDSPAARVAVRLKGSTPNSLGIGAKITVLAPPLPPQSQEIIAGGRYLSSDEPMRAFATGSAQSITIQVKWRSGKESVVSQAVPNQIYELDEASAQPASPPAAPPAVTPFFEDVSTRLGHVHHEEYFNDFARQPLLPKLLSQLGPAVAWLDLDGDGHDDLAIGAGRGGQLAVYQNDGKGGFKRLENPALKTALADDLAGMTAWTSKPGERVLLIGQANYESSETNSSSILKLGWQSGAVQLSPLTSHPFLSTTGPLAAADLDGDGDLDLFVGGRAVPGRYPENAGSHVFRNESGELKLDAANTEAVKDAGLVSGAVWGDLDGDGYPELILACEWGPVRIFRNDHGQLREATTEFGLGDHTGWWQSIALGDFDGDGRLDLVAGNWGLNSAYHPSAANPARLYHGDLDQNGTYDLLEAELEPATRKIVPVRSKTILGQAIPLIQSTFATHKLFANAAVSDVLAPATEKGREARATTLATTVFLNRGGKFEAHALPAEAQWSPTQGISVADFDGDGHEDIFLAQNIFALRPEDPRLDAGRGLWLRGDGKGGFQPVSGQTSGLLIEGEQRGCATSDFDEDGRVDLVVSQNGAATKLYRNRQAKPGLRVRLAGPPGNPAGIGAVIRLVAGDKSGPAREIHAGSGYWSQASVVVVLAATSETTGLSVRWPGGKMTTTKLTPGAKEVVINADGTAQERR